VSAGGVTSFTDAMVLREGGQRTFFHHVGANALLAPADFALGTSTARILHVGAPGLHPVLDASLPDGGTGWSTVLASARSLGMLTNLELVTLSPDAIRAAALPCLPHLDFMIVNELEAQAVTGVGCETGGPDDPVDWGAVEAAATALVTAGVGRLAVVHFPAGCVAAAPGGRRWRQGSVRMPAATVRSTTGAGDAFASGVMFGLHEGLPVPQCLKMGVCVAASSLEGDGTSDGIRPMDACLAAGVARGFRDSRMAPHSTG
jgi:sugar/nucleoside kinase (ribokinase family)